MILLEVGAEDIEPFNRKIEDACKQAVRTEIVIA